MKKIFRVERTIMRIARPIAGKFTDVPLPDESYYKAMEVFYNNLKGVDELLIDPSITSIRIVVNPEKMVLKESLRAYTYFNLFGINTDAVIVNKVLQKEDICPSLEEWLRSQNKYMQDIEAYFSPKPIFKIPYAKEELVGLEGLKWVAEKIFHKDGKILEPWQVFHKETPYIFEKISDNEVLIKIKLPYAEKKFLDIYKIGEELIIRFGNVKSIILLPSTLKNAEPIKAKWEEGFLKVYLRS
jgi:arsenite-transporting ATPase